MIRVGMQMKYGIVLVVSALSVLNSSARELLVITNEKRMMEICTEAIRTEHQALGFEKDEAFDLVQLTYQYVPGRPIDGEVLLMKFGATNEPSLGTVDGGEGPN